VSYATGRGTASSHKDALPLDFQLYLYDFSCLFDFLDALEDEQTA
jgi:hypothetical protein